MKKIFKKSKKIHFKNLALANQISNKYCIPTIYHQGLKIFKKTNSKLEIRPELLFKNYLTKRDNETVKS